MPAKTIKAASPWLLHKIGSFKQPEFDLFVKSYLALCKHWDLLSHEQRRCEVAKFVSHVLDPGPPHSDLCGSVMLSLYALNMPRTNTPDPWTTPKKDEMRYSRGRSSISTPTEKTDMSEPPSTPDTASRSKKDGIGQANVIAEIVEALQYLIGKFEEAVRTGELTTGDSDLKHLQMLLNNMSSKLSRR